MITKLSKIQKKILRFLFELDAGECIGTSELIIKVYDINLPVEFRNGERDKRNETDWRVYNSLHASLSRSIARLGGRGLIKAGKENQKPFLVLTKEGKEIAANLEPLPVTEKWKEHLEREKKKEAVMALLLGHLRNG